MRREPAGRAGIAIFALRIAAAAQRYGEPTLAEERDLREILVVLKTNRAMAAGRLFTEASVGKDRRYFDRLVEGLERAGLVTLAQETWTNPEGREVTFRKASLTYEGRDLSAADALGVLLPEESGAAPKPRRSADSASGEGGFGRGVHGEPGGVGEPTAGVEEGRGGGGGQTGVLCVFRRDSSGAGGFRSEDNFGADDGSGDWAQ